MNFTFIQTSTVAPTDEQIKLCEAINEFQFSELSVRCRPFFKLHAQVPVTIEDKAIDKDVLKKYDNTDILKERLKEINQMLKECQDDDLRIELEIEKDKIEKALKQQGINLLGIYQTGRTKDDEPAISLYIEPINLCGNSLYSFAQTYIHEMFHAYFDAEGYMKNSVHKVEEPITEYATLKFIEVFIKEYEVLSEVPSYNGQDFLNYAIKTVSSKKFLSPICYYGFGAYLYMYEQSQGKSLCDWIKEARNKSSNIGVSSVRTEFENKFRYYYPWEEEYYCMELLKDIFSTHGRYTGVTPATTGPIAKIYPHLKQQIGYSQDLCDCIDKTVENLNHSIPNHDVKEPGLLLGKIQSGKTRAFVGIIAKMFDDGTDVAIVMTKGTRALGSQSKSRLENDFRDFLTRGVVGQPVVAVHDMLSLKNGLSHAQLNDKNIIVCLKEKNNLEVLNNIIGLNGFDKKKVLIVDDEADFASRNYKIKTGVVDLARIANQIDNVVQTLPNCKYLQVTATPYSLYLQPNGEIDLSNGGKATPFKPRFTTLLPIYPDYIGGEHYYVKSANTSSMYSHLHCLVREECREAMSKIDQRYIKNVQGSPNLKELRWAILGYFIATAIRRIQERRFGHEYQSSCIVHADIAVIKHGYQVQLVKNLIGGWCDLVMQNGNAMPNELSQDFNMLYEDYKRSNTKGIIENIITDSIPDIQSVWKEVHDLMSGRKYQVVAVNNNTNVQDMLDSKTGQLKLNHALNVFVGGQILDRGITIANLICFFYGRDPKKLQEDTVLQHARMYGNRTKQDMAVTRFYTTQRLFDLLRIINDIDNEIREWLIEYSKNPNFDPSMAVVFSNGKGIVPCARTRIAVSDLIAFKEGKRMVPSGFQTDSKTAISSIIQTISDYIIAAPGYAKKDSDGIFEIDVATVKTIIDLIRTTYIYHRPIDNNQGLEWNEKEMLAAIEYATTNTKGKMWCMHRTNRNMSRVRANGGFIDAPDDGRTDLSPARAKATDMPIIILIRENGKASEGWRDAPFYWPVLVMPSKLKPVICTCNQ